MELHDQSLRYAELDAGRWHIFICTVGFFVTTTISGRKLAMHSFLCNRTISDLKRSALGMALLLRCFASLNFQHWFVAPPSSTRRFRYLSVKWLNFEREACPASAFAFHDRDPDSAWFAFRSHANQYWRMNSRISGERV